MRYTRPNTAAILIALTISIIALAQPVAWAANLNQVGSTQSVQTNVIAPGVIHHTVSKQSTRGPLTINVLDIDPKNPEISIEPALASKNHLHAKARVLQMASQNGAIAGINASFFKPDTGTVLGTMIMNKELLSGPLYNRVSLGMTHHKSFKMARLSLKGEAISLEPETQNKRSITIHNVNQPRLSKTQNILYNNRWNGRPVFVPEEHLQVQILDNRVVAIHRQAQGVPPDGYSLVGPSSGALSQLKKGDPVQLALYTTPDWSDVTHAISGGPYLVREGRVHVDLHEQSFKMGAFTQPAPRTAVGFTADNRLLMVTVDGRQKDVSVGLTLSEMAQLMKELGAIEAMNLDGGSSTQMVVKGKVVNQPVTPGGVAVSSSLLVKHIPQPIELEMIGVKDYDASAANF